MPNTTNLFACLVHENQECVVDLVRNLRHLDPDSSILLYNGGRDPNLLNSGFPFERYAAIVHPSPQPLAWGRLHPFALDCMKFALENLPFRTLTVVDSDQLAVRPAYSAYLAAFLEGKSKIGILTNSSRKNQPIDRLAPVRTARQEIDLWRPFLRKFPAGEKNFPGWTFWPSTVFTADAARDLLRLFATDAALQQIMGQTKILASEEVILPTLVSLLGYEIASNPCSNEYLRFREKYTLQHLQFAGAKQNVFWLHPVPRRYNDPLRASLRNQFGNYVSSRDPKDLASMYSTPKNSNLLLTRPILAQMKQVEGWLDEDEADLLMAAAAKALASAPQHAVVEVGSYCGRSTVVLGSVQKIIAPESKVVAIDPHDGKVGACDQGIQMMPPTLEKLQRNLANAGVSDFVDIQRSFSWEVSCDRPIGFLFIDALHDYPSVARDFCHFERWLAPDAYIAFHDYADYYPGVKAFVNELLGTGKYQKVHCVSSMIVLRRIEDDKQPPAKKRQLPTRAEYQPPPIVKNSTHPEPSAPAVPSSTLVSCIMPTADRPKFVSQAIQYFLRQDYPNRELIILDDGTAPVTDLIPQDSRIRYLRMPNKRTMGSKHNMACEMARGEIIVHWDDDDWMADRRLSYQVSELRGQPPMTLSGLARLLYYEPSADRAWEYVYPKNSRPWVCGNSFCYHKLFWERHPFPPQNEGADTVWVWGLRNQKVFALSDPTFYVAIIHQGNTSPKKTNGACWRPYPTQAVHDLMGADFTFYHSGEPQVTALSR